jgi:hypothetical protein
MEINGKILDSTNEPLYLANITIITGSQTNKFGTVANENGEFYLNSDIINADSQFKISYQGFRPQFYKASELQDRTIKLEEDIIGLEEIIIRPKDKPKNIIAESQDNNIKMHFEKHKLIYAGLGAIVAIFLLAISIKKLK